MKNKGYMTVEASVIVPVILFGTFVMILGLLLIYEKGYIRAKENEALYTIPLSEIRNDNVQSYLSEQNYTGGVAIGYAGVETDCGIFKASCEGRLQLYGNSNINSYREIDVRVDRLRRWQFYDETFGEYFKSDDNSSGDGE